MKRTRATKGEPNLEKENKDYLLFKGCLIPSSLPYMEAAARRALEILEIKIIETDKFSCCPDPVGIKAVSELTWLSMGARNLCIAQEIGKDILTLCNGCYETLKETSHALSEDSELLERVNKILSSFNRKYEGNTIVKHIAEVLYLDIGTNQISNMIKKPLYGLKVAAFYGCHLVRPSDVMNFDDPEDPKSLDELIVSLGADSLPRMRKMFCCGAPLLGVNMDLSLNIAKENLDNMKASGADCIVTLCPFCQTQFDRNQKVVERKFNKEYNLPVFYYPELLCIALGVNPDKLGFDLHRVKVDQVLNKIK
jgi:heterodisulfide reductase subunit B